MSAARPSRVTRTKLSNKSTRLFATSSPEGIERIDSVGVEFDPTVHDAVGQLPAEPPTGRQRGEP